LNNNRIKDNALFSSKNIALCILELRFSKDILTF